MLLINDIRDTILLGNTPDVLNRLPDTSVDCVVTSPPYWGLRDYGVDGQIGLEPSPEAFVETMVRIFRQVHRVLKDEGTVWLNLGDSYANDSKWTGLKPKDLVGIPWRAALALQADGWYLRQDIIWHKPNPMPESCRDRCTKSHEYIFLLSKSPRYYYDQVATLEDVSENTNPRYSEQKIPDGWETEKGSHGRFHKNYTPSPKAQQNASMVKNNPSFEKLTSLPVNKRNKRSVWTVVTQACKEAHFATFPEKLIEPCILAGCPEQVCVVCGKARSRMVEKQTVARERKTETTRPIDQRSPSPNAVASVETSTAGWTDCGCGGGFVRGIVLDPFMGAGTTGLVAYKNNRNYIGIELNPEYRDIAQRRIDAERDKLGLFE